jgi:hypothetical protein
MRKHYQRSDALGVAGQKIVSAGIKPAEVYMPKNETPPELFPHDGDTTPITTGWVWLNHYAKSKGGAQCPCCRKLSKYREYKIDSKLARLLIALYRCYPPSSMIKVRDAATAYGKPELAKGREWNKLAYWGLIENIEYSGQLTDKPTDYCRMTQRGQDFVYRNLTVPKKLWVEAHAVMGVDSAVVDIKQALGKKHDYNTLMNEPRREV